VASWCIQPFGHNANGPKIGEGAPPLLRGGELGPQLTTCVPSFILIHPTIWPQYTNVTDRQDRTDRTDRTVWQHRANCFTNGRPKTTHLNFTKFSVRVNCGRGSVILWRQCNQLCISGFVDDVIFAHNRPGKGDANRVYTQWLIRGSTGAKFDIYDCLVLNCRRVNKSSKERLASPLITTERREAPCLCFENLLFTIYGRQHQIRIQMNIHKTTLTV